MGLRLPKPPDDYDHVLDCLACHPAGQTPNYVFLRFWDITPCGGNPPPPQGWTFICAQDVLEPCYFVGFLEVNGITWRGSYHMHSFGGGLWGATVQLTSPDTPQPLFYYEKAADCAVDFKNNVTTCPPNAGTGGHAHIQVFLPPIIIMLTSHYHFVTYDDPLYEIQEVGMDHKMVHLAHRNGKTNVLIYLDDEEVQYP